MLWFLTAAAAPPPPVTVAIELTYVGQDHEGRLRRSESTTSFGPVEADFDGDGAPDVAIPEFSSDACPWTITYTVSLRRGDAWVQAGSVVGVPRRVDGRVTTTTDQTVSTAPANRPPVGHPDHPPEKHETTRTYHFDGDRIVLDDTSTKAGTCHHCSVGRCVKAKVVTAPDAN